MIQWRDLIVLINTRYRNYSFINFFFFCDFHWSIILFFSFFRKTWRNWAGRLYHLSL